MKTAHLADLHLGKTVNGFSMIEEQKHILEEILDILKEKEIQAVMIAGDVYDRNVPSIEATNLLDWFLQELVEQKLEVFMIAGNHDSGDRLNYGSALFENMHIHIAGTYKGTIPSIEMQDAYGPIVFHLLPFIRPVNVNRYIQEETEKAADYTEAVQNALQNDHVDPAKRNVILSHQFVTGVQVDENGSEELIVGGLDQVSGSVYDAYDYVCLGHIHRPQKVSRDTMVYSGTPLKYSFSEANQTKAVTLVEFKEKGNVVITSAPLHPLHEMREVKGTFQQIMHAQHSDDYMHVTLTDEEDVPDAIRDLRQIYPNIMKLDYDNQRTRNVSHVQISEEDLTRSPMEIFASFYQERTHTEMNEAQKKKMEELIHQIWEDEQ
jgi:exonuclease SbcD